MNISKTKTTFQKEKRHSHWLWKPFQKSSNYFLLHRHFKVTCTEIKQVLLGGSFCLENVFPTKTRALPALFLPLSPGWRSDITMVMVTYSTECCLFTSRILQVGDRKEAKRKVTARSFGTRPLSWKTTTALSWTKYVLQESC